MILGIDTAKIGETQVYLKNSKGKIVEILIEVQKPGSQVLLPMIQKILKNQKLDFKDLRGVEVKTGPGSFTGLRVGTSVANALGFGLQIPVNNTKIGGLVFPKYK